MSRVDRPLSDSLVDLFQMAVVFSVVLHSAKQGVMSRVSGLGGPGIYHLHAPSRTGLSYFKPN